MNIQQYKLLYLFIANQPLNHINRYYLRLLLRFWLKIEEKKKCRVTSQIQWQSKMRILFWCLKIWNETKAYSARKNCLHFYDSDSVDFETVYLPQPLYKNDLSNYSLQNTFVMNRWKMASKWRQLNDRRSGKFVKKIQNSICMLRSFISIDFINSHANFEFSTLFSLLFIFSLDCFITNNSGMKRITINKSSPVKQ